MPRIYDKLRDYTNWAFGIGVAVALFLLSKEELKILLYKDPIRMLFALLLVIITILRFFLYLRAVREELDLISEFIDENNIIKISGNPLIIGIFISVLMGFMIAYSTNIIVYTSIALVFSVIDMHGQATVNRNIGNFIFNKYEVRNVSESYKKAIIEYYFNSPLMIRSGLIVSISCAALILCLMEYYTHMSILGYLSYIIMILINAIGEITIWRWRRTRDNAIQLAAKQNYS